MTITFGFSEIVALSIYNLLVDFGLFSIFIIFVIINDVISITLKSLFKIATFMACSSSFGRKSRPIEIMGLF